MTNTAHHKEQARATCRRQRLYTGPSQDSRKHTLSLSPIWCEGPGAGPGKRPSVDLAMGFPVVRPPWRIASFVLNFLLVKQGKNAKPTLLLSQSASLVLIDDISVNPLDTYDGTKNNISSLQHLARYLLSIVADSASRGLFGIICAPVWAPKPCHTSLSSGFIAR
ncbi:hypothetical protein BYT27DRAFT_7254723 [Phlegmacium glaucopus]|nr:hypothetical protein BYT27DRAFT_7254723 [Phlegmacium glaucopus]